MIEPGLLPDDTRYFVAGGFAACPALASDVDVWVESGYYNVTLSRSKILTHLIETYGADVVCVEESSPESMFGYNHSGDCFQTMKVASLEGDSGMRYHIMVTTGTVHDVLAGFDISSHQVAITCDGEVIVGDDFTRPSEAPRVLRMTPTTPERLQKITQRYAPPVESVF